MTIYFSDTSALVKRYLNETGSQWVIKQLLPSARATIIISELTLVEMFSAIEARKRNSEITITNAFLLEGSFLLHSQKEYLIIPLNSTIIEDARVLTTKHPLRAADAIQLASASHALRILRTTMIFVCSDKRLGDAADAEGFKVEDPNDYR